ncbi:4'-phosphopantetheinyl transferase superfamily protein [Lutimonas saemankumensis]|uniref:4'-phosphopantetheinyl transferase family protein n=1 Tax=Lutimonas saemankumensis TaxID=483016 RepID=UPI001CD393A2|nr:4'-phosphopantetheinyl transferase superfamily protein [Lutimonas saemankumensis]MCA0932193.1 4'-phosphopantetheinyl transferase superfamily protein [Lutimonas saemankumensis]
MVGTDIVDLKEARVKSDWRRNGYLEKLFSKNEIQFIESEKDQEMAIWRLWSMKESAYKADFHLTRLRSFNPFKFECEVINSESGLIQIDSRIYHTRSILTKEYVLTWTINKKDAWCKPVRTGLYNWKIVSKLLYSKLKDELAKKLEMDPSDIDILKNEGVPEVFLRGHKADIFCSVSHHGRFGSFLCTV